MFRVVRQIACTHYNLFKWCRDYRSRIGILWDEFSKQCEEAQLKDQDDEFGASEREVRKGVWDRLNIQLGFWRQRVKGK